MTILNQIIEIKQNLGSNQWESYDTVNCVSPELVPVIIFISSIFPAI